MTAKLSQQSLKNMDFKLWEPIYQKILDDFGFERIADENAAKVLSEMISKRKDIIIDTSILFKIIKGKAVIVCGNGPSLKDDIKRINWTNFVTIVADGATSVILDNGLIPDIIVTDLDGDIEKEIEANKKGTIVVIHAHGDNIEALNKWVPLFSNIVCTTQSNPIRFLHNFGGFTDGDRAVYLANEFGAKSIRLLGFDFEDRNVSDLKKKKLKWAKYLIFQFNNLVL